MQSNSYAQFENEHDQLKAAYKSELKKICDKRQNKTLSFNDITEYMDVASNYFRLPEKYSPAILKEKRSLGGFDISSFADDCFAILESYVFHTILLKGLLAEHSTMKFEDIVSAKTLTNAQRIVVKYSNHKIDDLKTKFLSNNLSVHGFDVKNAKDELNLSSSEKLLLGFALGGIVLMLILAFCFPTPTNWQQFIQRGIMSLSIASLVATLPGFINLEIKAKLEENRIKIFAGGSLAIFILIYLINPAFVPT
jgi:hypothetical protein